MFEETEIFWNKFAFYVSYEHEASIVPAPFFASSGARVV